MKLTTLMQALDVDIKGNKDIEIAGICSHSKHVAPGYLFIARKGLKTSGSSFIEEAMRAGAVAVVTDVYNPILPITQVTTTNSLQALEAKLAQKFYNNPSKSLFLIGITGTDGKTTTAYVVKHLLEQKPHECGLIGTIEHLIGEHRIPSVLTTPDASTLNQYLGDMLRQGCSSAVMEVSSQALMQHRVDDVDFDVAVFTNLSQDHLDYHGTLEHYIDAKALLFTQLTPSARKPSKVAIVNLDDPYTHRMVKNTQAKILTYAISHPKADLRALDLILSDTGSTFVVDYLGHKESIYIPFIGRFNIYNILAALGVALVKGLSLAECAQKLKTCPSVVGRLQQVHNTQAGRVYIDYAHTEKALENVLTTLQGFARGKIITVIGCNGDRDKGKRPKMARVAEEYSDQLIITSDNPSSEDPHQIAQDMIQGLQQPERVLVEVDRKKAIELALSLAGAADTVLIAGKGHEPRQVMKDTIVAFSDQAVVEEYSSCRLSLT